MLVYVLHMHVRMSLLGLRIFFASKAGSPVARHDNAAMGLAQEAALLELLQLKSKHAEAAVSLVQLNKQIVQYSDHECSAEAQRCE